MMDVIKRLESERSNKLFVSKLDKYDPDKVTIPTRGSVDSAGLDLYSVEDAEINPQTNMMIHTGIAIEIPKGYVGLVFARSGLAHRQHLRPSNAVGVIDSDYRGEILVSLYNDSLSDVEDISCGQRIAQLVIVPYLSFEPEEVKSLTDTDRGQNGFGSTGK